MFWGGMGGTWNDEQEANWFYQGYGAAEVDLFALSYYRYERIVVDIASRRWRFVRNKGGNRARQ